MVGSLVLGVLACAARPPPVALSVPDAEGALIAIPEHGAKATVLEFWSLTCEPCEKSVPALEAERASLDKLGVRVWFVAVVEAPSEAEPCRAKLASWGVGGSFLLDVDGGLLQRLGLSGLPAAIVLDAEGRVSARFSGRAELGEIVEAARDAAD